MQMANFLIGLRSKVQNLVFEAYKVNTIMYSVETVIDGTIMDEQ